MANKKGFDEDEEDADTGKFEESDDFDEDFEDDDSAGASDLDDEDW